MVTAKYSNLCVTGGEMNDKISFGFAEGDDWICGDSTHKWCKVYEQPHSHSYAWTQLPDVLGWDSQGAKQTAKLPWEAPKTVGQLAWVELSAALIKELLLAKILSFKASSAAFAQAAVIYAIVPIDLSAISIE